MIMLAARGQVVDRVAGLAGADDYVTKPFEMVELLARTKQARRSPAKIQPADGHRPAIQIDFACRGRRRRDAGSVGA